MTNKPEIYDLTIELCVRRDMLSHLEKRLASGEGKELHYETLGLFSHIQRVDYENKLTSRLIRQMKDEIEEIATQVKEYYNEPGEVSVGSNPDSESSSGVA